LVGGPRTVSFRASKNAIVSGQLNGTIETSGLVTGSMLRPLGIATQGSTLTVQSGRWTLATSSAISIRRGASSRAQRAVMTTPVGLSLSLTTVREAGSALGLAGMGDYTIRGAKSTFASLGWSGDLAGFQITGEAMAGQTTVDARIARIAFAPMTSSGFRLQFDRTLLGGQASFGVTSPLRVDRAMIRFTSPSAFDISTRSVADVTRRFDLAPDAREVDMELGWATSVGPARLALGAAYGANAGNQPGVGNAAAWGRLSAAF
jgi:hypothetical protein